MHDNQLLCRSFRLMLVSSGVDLSEPSDALASLAFDDQKTWAQAGVLVVLVISLLKGCQRPKAKQCTSVHFGTPKAASSSHGERLQQAELALHELLEATLEQHELSLLGIFPQPLCPRNSVGCRPLWPRRSEERFFKRVHVFTLCSRVPMCHACGPFSRRAKPVT